MGLFDRLNPFASRPLIVPAESMPARLSLDEAAAMAERQIQQLAILPPVDVERTPRRPGQYEEPRQVPYLGSAFYATKCMTAWTVKDARAALDALDAGNFGQAGLMMEEMLRDDAVYHGYRTRAGRYFGLPQRYLPAQRDGNERRGGRRAARIWAKNQRLIFPQGARREIYKYLLFFNFAICSVQWITVKNMEGDDPPYWRLPQFKAWHPYFIRFITSLDETQYGGVGGDQASGHYQVITYNMGTVDLYGDNAPGRGRWVIFQGAGSRPWQDALIRPLTSPWLRRVYTRRDHGRFEEKHGLPATLIEYPFYLGGESPEFLEFQRNCETMGAEGVYMLPKDKENERAGVNVRFDGPPNSTAVTSFVESKKEEDRDIYTLFLGQTLTTEAGQDGGSHAAVLGMERRIDEKTRDDSQLMGDAEIEWYTTKDGDLAWHMVPGDGPIREQIGRFYAWYNFGDPDLPPHDFIDATPQADRKAMAEVGAIQARISHSKALAVKDMAVAIEKLETMNLVPEPAFLFDQINIQLIRPDDEENANPGLSRALAGIAKDGAFAGIDFAPTAEVRAACLRALRWLLDGYGNLSMLERVRVRHLATGKPWTPDGLVKARAFFAANEKPAEGMEGQLLWDAWGGDAGRAQVLTLYKEMERADGHTTRLLAALTEES